MCVCICAYTEYHKYLFTIKTKIFTFRREVFLLHRLAFCYSCCGTDREHSSDRLAMVNAYSLQHMSHNGPVFLNKELRRVMRTFQLNARSARLSFITSLQFAMEICNTVICDDRLLTVVIFQQLFVPHNLEKKILGRMLPQWL